MLTYYEYFYRYLIHVRSQKSLCRPLERSMVHLRGNTETGITL